jgi:hypothetical protein
MPQVYGAMPVLARVCRPLCLESEPSTRRIVLSAAGTSGLPRLLSSFTGRFPVPPELLLWWAHEEPSMGRRQRQSDNLPRRRSSPSKAGTCVPTAHTDSSGHMTHDRGMVDAGRHGPRRRQRRRHRPCSQLVHGLPARPLDGCIPARQCLGRRGRVSAPDADGWRARNPPTVGDATCDCLS